MSKKIELSKEEYEKYLLDKIEKLEEKIFPNEKRIAELEKIIGDTIA